MIERPTIASIQQAVAARFNLSPEDMPLPQAYEVNIALLSPVVGRPDAEGPDLLIPGDWSCGLGRSDYFSN